MSRNFKKNMQAMVFGINALKTASIDGSSDVQSIHTDSVGMVETPMVV